MKNAAPAELPLHRLRSPINKYLRNAGDQLAATTDSALLSAFSDSPELGSTDSEGGGAVVGSTAGSTLRPASTGSAACEGSSAIGAAAASEPSAVSTPSSVCATTPPSVAIC